MNTLPTTTAPTVSLSPVEKLMDEMDILRAQTKGVTVQSHGLSEVEKHLNRLKSLQRRADDARKQVTNPAYRFYKDLMAQANDVLLDPIGAMIAPLEAERAQEYRRVREQEQARLTERGKVNDQRAAVLLGLPGGRHEGKEYFIGADPIGRHEDLADYSDEEFQGLVEHYEKNPVPLAATPPLPVTYAERAPYATNSAPTVPTPTANAYEPLRAKIAGILGVCGCGQKLEEIMSEITTHFNRQR